MSTRRIPVLLATALIFPQFGCKPAADPVKQPEPRDAQDASVAGAPVPEAEAISLTRAELQAIVDAPDREQGDRDTDLRRDPVELLAFIDLAPGMTVADIGAGFGYMSELLARAVGPEGVVYGQNTSFVLDRFAREGWSARLAKPINHNVIALERPFDDPFPDEVHDLDRVVNVLFYHDFEWMDVDRAAHAADVFAALRPGGVYVIVDSSAAAGRGAQDAESLHRVEEALVIGELEAAGFELVAHGEFLRNPEDSRDWNALPWRAPERAERGEFSDKFVLAFRKP